MQFHCQVVRDLSAYRYDYAARLFQVNNIEYTLKRQLIEVKTITHIIVSRYGFRVIVNHDGLVTQLTCSLHGIYRTPVELYGRPDTVSTGTQYNH